MTKIKVIMKDGSVKYDSVPHSFLLSDIYGYLNDKYGSYAWENYEVL